MDNQPTAVLLEQAKSGSPAAVEALFKRLGGRLLGLIRLRLGRELRGRLESRDVLQQVMLKAFLHLDGAKAMDTPALMGWLAKIASNEIRDLADFHSRQRRDAARDLDLEALPGELSQRVRSQVSQLVIDEELLRLEQALERLDPVYREVILLRRFEELSFEEIAGRLDRSPDACRMLLARAMAALALQMRHLSNGPATEGISDK